MTKIVFLAIPILLALLAPNVMSQRSNFTSYTGDLKNSTAIIVWSLKYCNWEHSTHPPTHIAKDGDPKHTAECNKTYDFALNILSNAINTKGI